MVSCVFALIFFLFLSLSQVHKHAHQKCVYVLKIHTWNILIDTFDAKNETFTSQTPNFNCALQAVYYVIWRSFDSIVALYFCWWGFLCVCVWVRFSNRHISRGFFYSSLMQLAIVWQISIFVFNIAIRSYHKQLKKDFFFLSILLFRINQATERKMGSEVKENNGKLYDTIDALGHTINDLSYSFICIFYIEYYRTRSVTWNHRRESKIAWIYYYGSIN